MRNPFDTEERKTFREMVSKFLEAEIWPYVDEWDEAGEYPHEINEKVCELGVFGFGIDEKYGGLGFDDQFMRKDVSVEMGRTSAGGLFASVGSRNIMLGPLTELANEEIKLKALPDLMSGKKGGSLGITEPGGGSDVARMKTTARKDGNEWVLNGSKTFITGGMQASYFVIGARTGKEGLGGISLFFVEADTPGFTRSSIDKKMNAKTRVLTSKMIVHGRRSSRTIESKNWVMGIDQAFTEYLSPPREAGTKMLKLGDKLWTYSPQTDRVIQISGHMLRQSVMGSDMSYNDMMEDRPIEELYSANIQQSIEINGRDHWIIVMDAKVNGLAYPKRKAWIDKEYMLPIKEELYAKSGKLLKTSTMSNITKVQGRWFPFRFKYKDELKRSSKGTEWIIEQIEFNSMIPESRFSKALLRK